MITRHDSLVHRPRLRDRRLSLLVRLTVAGTQAQTADSIEDHFKYGSIGTEATVGVPFWIWRVLPIVFEDKLPNRPGTGYERLGFIDDGTAGWAANRDELARRPGRAQLCDMPCGNAA